MSAELAAVREVWAGRSQARTRAEALYLVYLAVLSVLILGVPALRSAGTFLARPDVLPALTHPLSPHVLGTVLLGAAAAMVLLGAVRGPALLAPFFTSALAMSGIRRRAVLWRPFLRALLVPVLGMVVVSALIAVTLVSAGADGAAALRSVLAAMGIGMLLGAAWLAGQLLTAGPRRLLVGVLIVAAAFAAALAVAEAGTGAILVPGAAALLLVPGSSTAAEAMVLLCTGIAAASVAILLLDRLRGEVLREQSQRWESVATIATSGDLAAASGALRTPPSGGRWLRAIGPRPLALLYARRDAVAWLRSPERLLGGMLVALGAAALLSGSVLLSGPLAGAAMLLGTGALWGASGTLVDGIRHAVHTLGAPTLFGQSAAAQVMLHALAPMLLLAALAAAGGGGVVLLAGGDHGSAVALPVALAPVLVAGRARDAAKGPMPLRLMTPMPTPQGDGAVLAMLAWQSDAILLALLSGALLAALAPLGALWLLVGAALLAGAMSLMARARMRALRG